MDAGIYTINMGAAATTGTGLHLYLCTFAGQDKRLKFAQRRMDAM